MANAFRKRPLFFFLIRPLRETSNPILEGFNYMLSYLVMSNSSLQCRKRMLSPEKQFHAKTHLLQEADRSFMHKELSIWKKNPHHLIYFQYSNHSVAYVPLHNTENKLKICSELRQHAIMWNNKTKQHSSEKVQNSTLLRLTFPPNTVYFRLHVSNLSTWKKTIHHSRR